MNIPFIQRSCNTSKRNKEDAKRWVKGAITFYRACGKRIALAEYTNPNGPFVQDEMYLFVLNPRGTMLAHGVNERFIGEDFSDLKDSDGKNFIKEMLDTANTQGCGGHQGKVYRPALPRGTRQHRGMAERFSQERC